MNGQRNERTLGPMKMSLAVAREGIHESRLKYLCMRVERETMLGIQESRLRWFVHVESREGNW